tara:strand:- start:225 stop:659 length:435 start_codon:yes stop_codon:yes gene_type:complete
MVERDINEAIDRQYLSAADRRYAQKMLRESMRHRRGKQEEPDIMAEFEKGIEDGTILPDVKFRDFVKRRKEEIKAGINVDSVTCAACETKDAKFIVEDLAVGTRGFCSEEHYALFVGLPRKPEGYYGFIKIGEENENNNREEAN